LKTCQQKMSSPIARLCVPLYNTTWQRCFQLSAPLCGAPMKKKKKLDPMIIKASIDRSVRKIEKRIRQQKRFARKLKPIDEFDLHRDVPKNAPPRQLDDLVNSRDEQRSRYLLRVEYGRYKDSESLKIREKFDKMIKSQEFALQELKLESPRMYEQACQKDTGILLQTYKGPTETPPIPGFIQDGGYKETTKTFDLDQEIVKKMLDKDKHALQNKRKRKNEKN